MRQTFEAQHASPHASHHWWTLAIRGVLAIIFGLIVLFVPGIALLAFITVFGVYAIIDGLVALFTAVRERRALPNWGWVLVEGVLSIIAGVVAFAYPGLTALVLLYLVAAWAVVTGIMEIIGAITLREYMSHEWALALAGVVSIVFGIILFARPGIGILSILWLVGIYSIVFGVLFIIRSVQSRSATTHMAPSAV